MWSSCESPVKGKLTETSLHILSDTLGHAPCSGQRFCSRFCVKCRTRGKGRSWPRRRGAEQRNAGVLPRPNTPSRALAPPGCRRRKVLPMCPVRSVTCVSGRSSMGYVDNAPYTVLHVTVRVTMWSMDQASGLLNRRHCPSCFPDLILQFPRWTHLNGALLIKSVSVKSTRVPSVTSLPSSQAAAPHSVRAVRHVGVYKHISFTVVADDKTKPFVSVEPLHGAINADCSRRIRTFPAG